MGYLATDAEIVSLLKMVRQEKHGDDISRRAEFVGTRLADYRYEYTVYNETIILDRHGQVQVNIDPKNRVTVSRDPLLRKTQAIDLHHDLGEDKYVETFRESDLCPGQGKVLVYSQKIEDPDRQATLGTLCLCFDFKDEMDRISKDLKQGNDQIVVAILDGQGNVMVSNRPEILSPAAKVPVDLDTDFRFLAFNGKNYLAATVATDGYQGFYGLTGYALAMIDLESAFKLDPDLVRKALGLTSSKAYCVSAFAPAILYGGRPAYIYGTAVRDPQNDRRAVGVIQIVFDAEPRFQAVLTGVLPKNEKKAVLEGSFALFADRTRSIVATTHADYPVGGKLPLSDHFFQRPEGARESTIVELGSHSYAMGLQVSEGYREYKRGDGYDNDLICMIFVPI